MNVLARTTLAGALASMLAVPVAAQQLEEIVVTATRRAESLQDIPISVATITGEAILEGGFSDMEDLSAFVPNLYMRDGFTGQRIQIRGIGTSTGNEAFEQAVAQFHDGVYYARDNLGQNSFFDLERVEVVRGPQPTFAGQSATAGALNYISRRPGDTLRQHHGLVRQSEERVVLRQVDRNVNHPNSRVALVLLLPAQQSHGPCSRRGRCA